MLKVIIFDFDGVIIDSERLHLKAFNEALLPYNVQISTGDYFAEYLGLSDRDLFKALFENNLLRADSDTLDRLLEQKTTAFENIISECKSIAGVREFLEMLKQKGISMAICSGALFKEITTVLNTNGLAGFFEVIVSAEQVERGKPHPDGFELALQKLNKLKNQEIRPSECIAIEDSHWGLEAAEAAGMHTIAITSSYPAESLKPSEKIINSLTDLTMTDLQRLCE
jgi:HAD superfamily hydrolase (TIGR01509 family)